jgi:hypothetical protein
MRQEMRQVLADLLRCARAHDPDSRILGNVRAGDAALALALALEVDTLALHHARQRIRSAVIGASVPEDNQRAIGALRAEMARLFVDGSVLHTYVKDLDDAVISGLIEVVLQNVGRAP